VSSGTSIKVVCVLSVTEVTSFSFLVLLECPLKSQCYSFKMYILAMVFMGNTFIDSLLHIIP
jgi:hypothetical protein